MGGFEYSFGKQKRLNRIMFKGDKGDKGDSPFPTKAPRGKCSITNMYVDPETHKVIIEYDNIPVV